MAITYAEFQELSKELDKNKNKFTIDRYDEVRQYFFIPLGKREMIRISHKDNTLAMEESVRNYVNTVWVKGEYHPDALVLGIIPILEYCQKLVSDLHKPDEIIIIAFKDPRDDVALTLLAFPQHHESNKNMMVSEDIKPEQIFTFAEIEQIIKHYISKNL